MPGRLCWFSRREVLPQGIYMQDGDFVIAWNDTREVICNRKDLQIFGGHNEENVLAAIGAAFFAGVEPCNIAEVLKTLKVLSTALNIRRQLTAYVIIMIPKQPIPILPLRRWKRLTGI